MARGTMKGLRKMSKSQRKQYLRTEFGILGNCVSCGFETKAGFRCSCTVVECLKCWYKRTKGHENSLSPLWKCPTCGMITIYDRDMNFIRRFTAEQYERWKSLEKEAYAGIGAKEDDEKVEGNGA